VGRPILEKQFIDALLLLPPVSHSTFTRRNAQSPRLSEAALNVNLMTTCYETNTHLARLLDRG
jgi:hypothetical protein